MKSSLAPLPSTDSPVKSIYFVLAGIIIFSIQDVIIKSMSGKYPVHEIVFLRSCISAIPLLIFIYRQGGPHPWQTKRYGGHLLRSVFMFAAYMSFYLALAALPLAETVSLYFTHPIFVTILSVACLQEKVRLGSWLAVFVGFIGIAVMVNPGSDIFDPAAGLALMTAVCYGTSAIITRKIGQTESGLSLAFHTTVLYIVFSALLSIGLISVDISPDSHPSYAFLFRAWQVPTPMDCLLIIILSGIAAAGFYFLSQAYRLAQPSSVAPFEYIAVPLSVMWGFIFWNDTLQIQSIIGIILIVGSGLYIFKGMQGKGKHRVGSAGFR